jgi:pimeloyl-ACP methyl ester carboxylesterase
MTAPPTLEFFPLEHRNSKRMAYWQWGDITAKHLIVCVHGLTRQGRDFDVLAQALLNKASIKGDGLRIICVDIIGRGQSDWLDEPMGYAIPNYAQDMMVFLAALHASAPYETLDWVGTSMGGIIGMAVLGAIGMGAAKLPVVPQHLVLNDVGPTIEWTSLKRIGEYLGQVGGFATQQQAADAMWVISKTFGPHTPEQWLALSIHQLKQKADRTYTLNYDPSIALPFKAVSEEQTKAGEAMIWQLYENITAQTLITRGLESDLLSSVTAKAMTERGFKMPEPARLVEFEGVGHAPTFVVENQHSIVVNFLLS